MVPVNDYTSRLVLNRLIPSFRGALTLRSLRLLRIVSFLRLERSYSAMKNLRLIFTRKKVLTCVRITRLKYLSKTFSNRKNFWLYRISLV
jgi:hypothetical protein